MKILLLAPTDSPLAKILTDDGHEILHSANKIVGDAGGFDFLISYGYRHIVKKRVLDYFGKNAINLHISYLPYNKGADPNFWAHYDGTPSGVTIHHMDEGIDTGNIILQRKVVFEDNCTLATSYHTLHDVMVQLFTENMDYLLSGEYHTIKQRGKSTYHNSKDKDKIFAQLEKGWDTPINKMRKN